MTSVPGPTSPKDLVRALRDPRKLASFATSAMTTSPQSHARSALRLLQAAFANSFLSQLSSEINEHIEAGRIKEGIFATPDAQAALYELLDCVDSDPPDEERIKAMKAIFLRGVSKDTSDAERRLARQLLATARQLSGSQILTLRVVFDVVRGGLPANVMAGDPIDVREWLEDTAQRLGHGLAELVEVDESKLMEMRLIGQRRHPDRSGITLSKTWRLTNLGVKFCEFMSVADKQ